MKWSMIAVVGVVGIFAIGGAARADVGHFEGFESGEHSWNSYYSQLEGVASGTGGIASSGGSYHLQITDPVSSEDHTGAYSWLGGKSATWGGGWSSSIDIYVDLNDSTIKSGTYGFHLSQSICDTEGSPYLQDNIWHVGAVDDGNSGFEVGVNTGHNTDTTPSSRVLNPANYHNVDYGTLAHTGWYTFETAFGPSTSTQHPDKVDVTWTLYDAAGNVVWYANETTEHYKEEEAGGDGYLWFKTITADKLHIDNVAVVPEPATLSLLAVAGVGVLLKRRKR